MSLQGDFLQTKTLKMDAEAITRNHPFLVAK